MAKKVRNFLRKLGQAYMRGAAELYGSMIRYNVSPIV